MCVVLNVFLVIQNTDFFIQISKMSIMWIMGVVSSGYPPILGDDILLKRRYVREQLDHLRVLLMAEPRGHADMYGAILVTPNLPEADMAVLFMHNEGK